VITSLSATELDRRRAIVINDHDGIVPHVVVLYVLSIEYSARAAVSAFMQYSSEIENSGNDGDAVSYVHEALTHCAALSRFFWPTRPKPLAAARALKLRTLFKIDDDSPLKNRALRNALEHFDERLDDFMVENDIGYFLPQAMLGSHELLDNNTNKIFKMVDPLTEKMVILNNIFEFAPLAREASAVLLRVDELDKSP
jgi:hypothetical protein